MKSERESIIKEITEIMPCSCIAAYKLRELSAPDCPNCNYVEDIADFILNDRKMILNPLIRLKKKVYKQSWGNTFMCRAIDKSIANAGLLEDK